MGVKDVQKLKELERESSELKKMLADQMLKNRALEIVLEKTREPRTAAPGSTPTARRAAVLWAASQQMVEI